MKKQEILMSLVLAHQEKRWDRIESILKAEGLEVANNNIKIEQQIEKPVLKNIQSYLEDYRMLTDTIYLKPAYIINIQVNFDIITRPNYTSRTVIAACLTSLKAYFARVNWQINQPIILSEIYSLLDQVAGVQTVQKVTINNLSGTSSGYSQYSYDISAATLNGVIYPSLDPSIFEVKYPDADIQGRVVTM
jgi:hypothetical protein